MKQLPPDPRPGDKVTAEWARRISGCIRERQLRNGPNYKISTGPNGTYLQLELPKRQIFQREPLPFEVRWSASAASGEGAWVIWLPDKTRCVCVSGAYVTPTGITDDDDLPAGWYTIDNADAQATSLYLVVTTDDSTGATTAEVDTAAGTASTGETVTNIIIASLVSDSQTGAKRVRQFVVGALALGTGEAGETLTPDDVSTEVYHHEGAGTPSEEEAAAEGKLQIKGWVNGDPLANHSLAEILSGREVAGAISPPFNRDAYVVVRCTDGSLAYVQIGKIFTDDESVEFKANSTSGNLTLQVKGFDAAQTGQVPVKRNNAIAWEAQSGGADISALNGVTLVTNVEWIGSPTYAIRVSKRTATVANNTLTLGPVATTDIATTPITDALS